MGSPGCLREPLGGVGGFRRLETGGQPGAGGTKAKPDIGGRDDLQAPQVSRQQDSERSTGPGPRHPPQPPGPGCPASEEGNPGSPVCGSRNPKRMRRAAGTGEEAKGTRAGLGPPGASQPRQEQEAAAAWDLGPRQQLCARGRGGDAAALPAQRSALSASSSPSDAAGARMVLRRAGAGLRSLLRRRLPHLSAPRSATGCRRRPGSARARPALGPSCAAPAGAAAPAPQRASHPAAASASASCRPPLKPARE